VTLQKQKPKMPRQNNKDLHTPVMVREVLEYLDPKAGESYLDVTAGYGGHAEQILQKTKAPKQAVLIDRDAQAVKSLQERFGELGARIIHQDFSTASQSLEGEGKKFDMILADLGVSSPHLDQPDRGFAIASEGPLDMRMDTRQPLSAGDLVNNSSQEELELILKRFGEEPKARLVARAIVQNRPIASTTQLAAVIRTAVGWRGRRGKIHPATRSFQALRIAVNDELYQLEGSLPVWMRLLKPDGRLVVISFHSLEDRITKRFFAEHAANTYDAELISLTKKPLSAKSDEIVSNPRARSAKLRASRKK
jgi:16S rRNA (cytosine1402-N4)-methyltransferase